MIQKNEGEGYQKMESDHQAKERTKFYKQEGEMESTDRRTSDEDGASSWGMRGGGNEGRRRR